MRRATLIAALALLLAGCGGHPRANRVGGQAAPTARTLLMADGGTDPGELEAFVKRARDLSGDTLRIKLRDSWRAGQTTWETGVIRDAQAGKADLGWAAPRAWDTVGILSFRALNAPLLIDTYALQEKVLMSPVVKPMLAGLAPLGLVGLGILPGQMRRPFGLRQPLLRPEDFAGRTLGVQESNVADATLRALGARTIRLPVTRVDPSRYDGLEQRVGTVDAWYSAHGGYFSANVNLWPRPMVLFVNARVFASLTASQQDALRQAAVRQIRPQTADVIGLDRESSGNICRAGRVKLETATDADLAALRRAVRPVYGQLERDPATRSAITAIEQLKRDSPPAAPDTLPACHMTAAGSTKRTAVDGTWTMTTTRRDAPPDYLAENWGRWIFVLDRGRFADTQENATACTWGYGTYVLKGATMQWTFKHGGGKAPNGAYNKPGELFVFGWSRYRDTLTLTPVKGQRLASRTPSRAHFSRHCPPPAAALNR
jgi:TRAP-type C4-dicarboxylate transport system substrate-binding protein